MCACKGLKGQSKAKEKRLDTEQRAQLREQIDRVKRERLRLRQREKDVARALDAQLGPGWRRMLATESGFGPGWVALTPKEKENAKNRRYYYRAKHRHWADQGLSLVGDNLACLDCGKVTHKYYSTGGRHNDGCRWIAESGAATVDGPAANVARVSGHRGGVGNRSGHR